MSFANLQDKIDKLRNPSVVGLDPDLAHIPPELLEKHFTAGGETLDSAALAVYEFNTGLIDALCDIVPAIKPQSAYYEALGPAGVLVLKKTCDYAREKGMYVIIDGKRNDIGSTAAAYAAAYLGAVKVGGTELSPFNADALTVNAYLGSDGIKPFIDAAVRFDKAVFALVRTSNPSAGELQDLCAGAGQGDGSSAPRGKGTVLPPRGAEEPSPCPAGKKLYTAVGDLMEQISAETVDRCGYTCVGAVVGATYPEEMKFLRDRLKHTFFLVPGYGAQGGGAADAALAFDANGKGAIVNSSRAIIAAWKVTGTGYAAAAREEAIKMRDELCKIF